MADCPFQNTSNVKLGIVSPHWRYGDHKISIVAKGCMLLGGEFLLLTPSSILIVDELSKELVGAVFGTVAQVGWLRANLSSGRCRSRLSDARGRRSR